MADNFVKTPMEYESGPTNPKPPGKYDGDPAFPTRSAHPGGVDEKTYEDWPTSGSAAEGSPAPGTPIVGPNIKA